LVVFYIYPHLRVAMISDSPLFRGESKQQDEVTAKTGWVAKLLTYHYFEAGINALICINVICMIMEADDNAKCLGQSNACSSRPLWYLNLAFLALYTVEMGMKIFVYRLEFFIGSGKSGKRQVHGFNYVDLFVVITGIFTAIMESIGHEAGASLEMLRLLRILRLARAVPILGIFPELQKLVEGFMSAMTAMAWGILLIVLLLIFFAIISVEIVHPLNLRYIETRPEGDVAEWCEAAFDSVFNATLLFFQTLVAGDSWGSCILPLVRYQPAVGLIFICATGSVQMGFLNLILSVVVDSAARSRVAEHEEVLKEKQEKEVQAVNQLQAVIAECDLNKDGEVSLEELQTSVINSKRVATVFEILDVKPADLEDMFNLMDLDDSGTLSPIEFISAIRKAEMQDMRVQMMLMQLQLKKIVKTTTQNLGIKMQQQFGATRSGGMCPVDLDEVLDVKGKATHRDELASDVLITDATQDTSTNFDFDELADAGSLKNYPLKRKECPQNGSGKEDCDQNHRSVKEKEDGVCSETDVNVDIPTDVPYDDIPPSALQAPPKSMDTFLGPLNPNVS